MSADESFVVGDETASFIQWIRMGRVSAGVKEAREDEAAATTMVPAALTIFLGNNPMTPMPLLWDLKKMKRHHP